MKIALLIATFITSFFATCQYKRFAIESYTAFGKPIKGSSDLFISYGGRLQFNLPKIVSFFVGFGQENQSITHSDPIDIPGLGYKRSVIHTNELFMPLSVRASFGRRFMFFVEPGIQLNFSGTANWEGMYDYTYNGPGEYVDQPFSYKEKMLSGMTLSLSAGIVFPVYRGLHGYVKVGFPITQQMDYSYNDDVLSTMEIVPYSDIKYSFGLSYFFNLKKESKYTFTSYYLKLKKVTNEVN